eukprot:gene1763-2317_t
MPKFCTASGSVLNAIKSRSTDTFTIQARDGFGNAKSRGGDPFEVGIMGPAVLKGLVDNNNGTYTCSIEANTPTAVNYVASSSLLILVTLGGKPIAGSPFKPLILDDGMGFTGRSTGATTSTAHPSSPYRQISTEE